MLIGAYPVRPSASPLLALALIGCGASNPARVESSMASVEVAESPETAAEAPVEAPARGPVDPCVAGHEHDFVASLADGARARQAAAAAPPADDAVVADLDDSFRSLGGLGVHVASLMRLDLGDANGPILAAITYSHERPLEESGVLPRPSFQLLRCVPSEGYRTSISVPSFERAATWIAGREVLHLGSEDYLTLRVVSDFVASDERREDAFLVTHPDAVIPFDPAREPRHGILEIVGAVASTRVHEGESELTTESAYDATGWFANGDRAVYLSFVRETRPRGRSFAVSSFVRPLATADAERFHTALTDDGFSPFYLLVGRGDLPAVCAARAGITCRRLTMHGDALPELRYAWVAGFFAADDATLASIRVRDARWLFVAPRGTPTPRRGPDGRAPITAF